MENATESKGCVILFVCKMLHFSEFILTQKPHHHIFHLNPPFFDFFPHKAWFHYTFLCSKIAIKIHVVSENNQISKGFLHLRSANHHKNPANHNG